MAEPKRERGKVGIFLRLGQALSGKIGRATGSLARLAVPGHERFELPAGKATIYYQEKRSSYKTVPGGDGPEIHISPPSDFSLAVRGDAGEVPVEPPGWWRSSYSEGSTIAGSRATAAFARCRLGTVDLPAAGTYEIVAAGTPDPECELAELLVD